MASQLPSATRPDLPVHGDLVTMTPVAAPSTPARLPRIQIGNVHVHAVGEAECVAHVLAEIDAGRGGWLLTANVDHLRLIEGFPGYAALVATASVVVADGMPLVWASRISGESLPERVAGSNLVCSLSRAAAVAGRSVFLLGGNAGTAEAAARVLCEQAADLRIAGTLCPPHGFDRDTGEVDRIVAAVAAAAPDIVYVGLGAPRQDLLIARLRQARPRAWYVGVGISFSFLGGEVRRAPHWMQRAGLEWLHRMTQEPRRLTPRYLRNLPFGMKLIGAALAQRLRREPPAGGAPR